MLRALRLAPRRAPQAALRPWLPRRARARPEAAREPLPSPAHLPHTRLPHTRPGTERPPRPAHSPAALTWAESQLLSFLSPSSRGAGGTAVASLISAESSTGTGCASSALLAPWRDTFTRGLHQEVAEQWSPAGRRQEVNLSQGREVPLWGGTRPRFGYRPKFYPAVKKGQTPTATLS